MKTHQLQLTYTLATIGKAAQDFRKMLDTYRVFAFSGEMGAGKTTFIHKLCDNLGVTDAVSSPTFALVNEYHFEGGDGADNTIYHLDWYRLKDTAEAINAGMEDCIMQSTSGYSYAFIEWPEKAMELLQTPYLWISISSVSDNERVMDVWLVN